MPRNTNQYLTNGRGASYWGFAPAAFQAAVFTPEKEDMSLLQRSLTTLDERKERTDQQRAAIQSALSKIKLNAAEDEWKTNYINDIIGKINAASRFGDYSAALEVATTMAGEALSNPGLLGRQRANEEYEKYKTIIENRNDLNQVTKDRWLATNPYHYEDIYSNTGQVIGGTNWTPNWNPVSRYDMTKLYGLAQQLAAKEAGGGESAQFLDENGNLTSDPAKGFYGMAVKRGSKWERLSKQKLQNVFDALFKQAPEAMDALMQDMDDRKWQYDNATDEQKKSFIGSDLIKDDGTFRTPNEYLSYRVNPVLSEMAYNHVYSSVDFGGAYAARAKAISDKQAKENLLTAQNLQNNTTMTVPIEIDMKDRAGRSFGSINTAMDTINRLYGDVPIANNPEYKRLVNNSDYKGLANYLSRFKRFFKDDANKMNAFNASLRLLREEGDTFKSIVGNLTKSEQDAVKTYFSAQSGITPKDALDNPYTRELAQLKNNLFSYSTPNGTRENSDNVILQFGDNSYQSRFFNALGLSERELGNHGIQTAVINGKPSIIINKNTDILSDIATANASLKRDSYFGGEPSVLLNVRNDGTYTTEGVFGKNSVRKLNALNREAPSFSRLERNVKSIFDKYSLKSIEPLQVMPYDDYNTVMLNKMWTSGQIEDADYKELKKEFEDNNIKELGYAMQHPNNYTFYAATEEHGNAVKLTQSEVEDRVENILKAVDQGLIEIAPSGAPTGKGYGTIVRIKGKAKSGNNEEVKNDILYIDGLFDGPASQAIARNPETLFNHSFKTARALNTKIKGIDGTYINYSNSNAINEYKASKLLDEVYGELDELKSNGKTINEIEASAIANSLIEKAGYSTDSEYAKIVRPKLISNLLKY